MSVPVRIQLRRTKGWRMPLNTVKVDRSTRWGNPFYVGADGIPTAGVAIGLFRKMLERQAEIAADHKLFVFTRDRLRADLRGKNLACWCALPKSGEPDHWHAAVLLEFANS